MEREKKEKTSRRKRVLYEEQEIDGETGEIIKRKTTLQFSKEPAYVKLYFDCLGVIIKNEGLNESLNDMLLETLKLGSYADEEQTVILNAYQKEKICKKTGKSLRRLEQAITIWVKNKILFRVSRGTYRINPWIFGKGEWRDISDLRASFDFKAGNLTLEREYEIKTKSTSTITKTSETPISNAPQSPETHEKTNGKENVSEEKIINNATEILKDTGKLVVKDEKNHKWFLSLEKYNDGIGAVTPMKNGDYFSEEIVETMLENSERNLVEELKAKA